MKDVSIRCLLCLALALPLAACERGARGPDSEAPETAPVAAGEPASEATASPTASDPTVPPVGTLPDATPALPGVPGAPTAAPSPSRPLARNTSEVPRMPVSEAAALAGRGEIVLVDVRDAGSFAAQRIEAAVSLPLGEVAARAAELPREKVIVIYCA